MKLNLSPLILCCCLQIFTSLLFAQSYLQQIDSLKILLEEANGEEKVDLLNEISYSFRRIAPDSVLTYAKQARQRKIQQTLSHASIKGI